MLHWLFGMGTLRGAALFVVGLLALLGRSAPCCGEPEALSVPAAIAQLSAADPLLRATAASELARRYPAGAMGAPLLVVCLRDEDPRVRGAARDALLALASKGARAIAAFLRDEAHPQNTAFREGRKLVLKLRSRITPWDLNDVEGRAARAVRLCLSPIQGRGASVIDRAESFSMRLIASDAGLSDLPASAKHLDHGSRIACAALAVFGIRYLDDPLKLAAPAGLTALLEHEDEGLRWAGGRLMQTLRAAPPSGGTGRGPVIHQQTVPELIRRLGRLAPLSDSRDLFYVGMTARRLARHGSDATPALPLLRAVYRELREAGGKAILREDVSVAGAICWIEGPTTPYIEMLSTALTVEGENFRSGRIRARYAAQVLAGCRWGAVSVKSRSTVAEAAAKALVVHNETIRTELVVLLGKLGDSRARIGEGMTRVVVEADSRLRALAKIVEKQGLITKGPGKANSVFVARPIDYLSAAVLLDRAARALAHLRPLSKEARKTLSDLVASDDPHLGCTLSAALR